MAVNSRAVKLLNKLAKQGCADEQQILSIKLEDILQIPGITVAEIGLINQLQKAIASHQVIAFLLEEAEQDKAQPEQVQHQAEEEADHSPVY